MSASASPYPAAMSIVSSNAGDSALLTASPPIKCEGLGIVEEIETLLTKRHGALQRCMQLLAKVEESALLPTIASAKLFVKAAGFGDLEMLTRLRESRLSGCWNTNSESSAAGDAVAVDEFADTPAHAAARSGHDNVIALLKKEAGLSSCWTARNKEGHRPLDLAVKGGQASTAKLLADILQGPNNALQLAARENNAALVALL